MHFARVKLEYSIRGSPKQVPEKSKDIWIIYKPCFCQIFSGGRTWGRGGAERCALRPPLGFISKVE